MTTVWLYSSYGCTNKVLHLRVSASHIELHYGMHITPFFYWTTTPRPTTRRRKSIIMSSLQKRGGSIFLDPIRGSIQLPIDVLQRDELIVQRGD